MEKYGVVTSILENFAEVTIIRDSACGENCSSCGLCENNRTMTVKIKNNGEFKKGDKIKLSSDTKTFVAHSALGYLSLTILLIAGAAIGGMLGSEWLAFVGGIVGVLLGILIIRIFFSDKLEIKAEKIED